MIKTGFIYEKLFKFEMLTYFTLQSILIVGFF